MSAKPQSFALMQKAVSLHKQGQISDAEQSYRDVLAIDPLHPDALRLLGGLYVQWKKSENAVDCFEKALGVQPNNPELLTNLGVALYAQGKVEEAIQHYQQAVLISPDYWDAIHNLGNALYASGKLEEAVTWLERAAKLRPNGGQAHIVLGRIFHLQKIEEKAIFHYKRALKLAPDNIEVLTNLGNLFRGMGRSTEASDVYQRLIALKPDNVDIRLNLGTIFHDLRKWNEAMAQYEQALVLNPQSTEAMINRAGLLIELDRPEEAVICYDQALVLNPRLPDARWGKSLALLMLGNYAEGWRLYESRFEQKAMRNVPFSECRWDGRHLNGKRLLIWGEQGFGDVLQFIRYAVLCKEQGGTIVVMCRESLVRLLQNCPFIDEVVLEATKVKFDYQIPVMSLPFIFGTIVETIPNQVPYLNASNEARDKWQSRFADAKGLKVGLVWAGNPRKQHIDAHITDRQRSLSFSMFKSLLDVEGCTFYSLQKGAAADEIKTKTLQANFIDYMNDVEDFMDTAALIENLDLVISVDTSVVHLAGALGKPVWVLSRFGGCWRWLRNQETNPWYPTAHVFSPPTPDDWKNCIVKVRDVLSRTVDKQVL